MNDTPIPIPAGYRMNPLGHLVPESLIDEVDKLRDELVNRLVAKAERLSAQIEADKSLFLSEIDAFVGISLSEYGIERGGQKGNITLLSFDGRLKVVRAIADVIRFDERLRAAKALIDECLNEWSTDARAELRVLIHDAFEVDKENKIRIQQVLSLRRLKIDDPRWREAMRAIGESIEIVRTKAYVRFYERIGDSDQWRPIPLDIAALPASTATESTHQNHFPPEESTQLL
jgi:Protein of unknown function (DUF3164)